MAVIAATTTLAITETVTPEITRTPTRPIRAGTATRTTTILLLPTLLQTADMPVALITTMVVAITTANAITRTSQATITARKRRN